MADEDTTPRLQEIRTPDFTTKYANNVRLEASYWDVRAFFGTLDQTDHAVAMHTAINIPWPQLKLMVYYAFIHIGFNEGANGTIRVSPDMVPDSLEQVLPDLKNEARGSTAWIEFAEALRQQLFFPKRQRADKESQSGGKA